MRKLSCLFLILILFLSASAIAENDAYLKIIESFTTAMVEAFDVSTLNTESSMVTDNPELGEYLRMSINYSEAVSATININTDGILFSYVASSMDLEDESLNTFIDVFYSLYSFITDSRNSEECMSFFNSLVNDSVEQSAGLFVDEKELGNYRFSLSLVKTDFLKMIKIVASPL